VVTVNPEEQENEIKQTWRLFTSKRMLKLVPLLCYSGISMAVYQAALAPLMTLTMDPKWDDNT
jgi:MFS family permease